MAVLKRTLRRALVCLGGAVAAGCGGEGLVDDTYEGEVVESFSFSIESGAVEGDRLAVFWWKALQGADSLDGMQEDLSSAVVLSPDTTEGELKLFNAPSDALLHEVDGTDGKRLAVGSILAYADADGSGSLNGAEAHSGKVIRRFILYAPERIPAQEGLNAAPILPGFHIVQGPVVCGGRPPTETTCDVPFGRACYGDENCGAGTCMEQTDITWAHGACVLLSERSDCVPSPENARPVRLPPRGLLFGQSCQSDEDCARLGRYECEPMAGICLPGGEPLPVYFGEEAVLRAELCGSTGGMGGMGGMGGPRPRPSGDGGTGMRPPPGDAE